VSLLTFSLAIKSRQRDRTYIRCGCIAIEEGVVSLNFLTLQVRNPSVLNNINGDLPLSQHIDRNEHGILILSFLFSVKWFLFLSD
jgi:hypothetical protein